MCNPKVSVLCIAYNHERYIRKTLDGILNQECEFNYEVIVNDDASTDNTGLIIKEYYQGYPDRIIPILGKENQYSRGVCWHAELLKYTSGEYIAICEGDDYWTDTQKLQKQVDVMELNPQYSGCGHNVSIIDECSALHSKGYIKKSVDVDKKEIKSYSSIYTQGRFAHTCSLIFRKSMFDNMTSQVMEDYKHLKINGDNRLSALMLANGRFLHLAEDMSCYRYVVAEGSSWNARIQGKNLTFLNAERFKELQQFMSKYFSIDGLYTVIIDMQVRSAIDMYLSKPNDVNKKILKNIMGLWISS